jgi:hypothetical protein
MAGMFKKCRRVTGRRESWRPQTGGAVQVHVCGEEVVERGARIKAHGSSAEEGFVLARRLQGLSKTTLVHTQG